MTSKDADVAVHDGRPEQRRARRRRAARAGERQAAPRARGRRPRLPLGRHARQQRGARVAAAACIDAARHDPVGRRRVEVLLARIPTEMVAPARRLQRERVRRRGADGDARAVRARARRAIGDELLLAAEGGGREARVVARLELKGGGGVGRRGAEAEAQRARRARHASLVRSSAPRTLLVETRGGASSYWRVTSA